MSDIALRVRSMILRLEKESVAKSLIRDVSSRTWVQRSEEISEAEEVVEEAAPEDGVARISSLSLMFSKAENLVGTEFMLPFVTCTNS